MNTQREKFINNHEKMDRDNKSKEMTSDGPKKDQGLTNFKDSG